MTNIALIGYGKMGRAIEELVSSKFADRFSIGLIIDLHNRGEMDAEMLRQCDVAIEFTGPASAVDNILLCMQAGVPVVSGSTGWTKRLRELQEYAAEHEHAFLYAPNFSIGVNLFFELNRRLAVMMDDHPSYDVVLEEIHHTEKKDSPSGTALFAAFDILQRLHRKDGWKNRESSNAATLEIFSKRVPDVPGTHTVRYFNDIDEIEIKHTAKNRTGFATGALLAAEWLVGKVGAYGMEDVLGFSSS
jgi:4-hydroxy-tetrahydrodipicolinate reductase